MEKLNNYLHLSFIYFFIFSFLPNYNQVFFRIFLVMIFFSDLDIFYQIDTQGI